MSILHCYCESQRAVVVYIVVILGDIQIESFGININDGTHGNSGVDEANIIRIRGLPWNTTVREICDFFEGVNILHGENGVHLITLATNNSKPLGEAYIELASSEDFELAKTFHKKNLGTRYIEGNNAYKAFQYLMTLFTILIGQKKISLGIY